MFEISVILCTHNPRKEYLQRTLEALKEQSLAKERWELLLIDNASNVKIVKQWDLSWHANAKHLFEPVLGLTAARLCGITNALGEIFVFVDDDNVLDKDYLKNTLVIAEEFPLLGVFGGAQVGEFEKEPPEWMQPLLSILAVRDVSRNVWSNLTTWETTPAGAGMVVRAIIAKTYLLNTLKNPTKKLLGRKGNNTFSAEDVDMAYTGIDMGYGCGRLKNLSLIHLIPKERIEEKYLIKLHEGIITSKFILDSFRNPNYSLPQENKIMFYGYQLYRLIFKPFIHVKLEQAKHRALKNARKILSDANLKTNN